MRRTRSFRQRASRFAEPLEPRTLLAANVIDLMVVYDAGVKAGLGNVADADVQRLIRQSVDPANRVHLNTGDNVVLRLVYAGQVNYASTGNVQTDLTNLQAGAITSASLAGSPTVAAMRTTFGA